GRHMNTGEQMEPVVETAREELTLASVDGHPDADTHVPTVDEAIAPAEKLPPLWRNRDYMLLWSGQVVSALGSSMSNIVFPLLILALANEDPALAGIAATLAGLAGALASLPYLIFSLPVGALIDRWDRKRVMIICDLLRAVNFATIPIAMFTGTLTIWQLFANAFIEGTFFVFFNIAEVAALPRVVQKRQLPQASAQNEAGFIAAFAAGPPLGGFLFGTVSRALPFIIDAVSYAFSVVSLLFIKTKFQGERKVEERHIMAEIKEGLSWLWQHPLIRYMALLTGASNFVGSATGLILIVMARQMGASETEIGWMFTIGSLGGIAGSVLGGQIQKRFTFGQVIITVGWVNLMLLPLYLLAPNFFFLGVVSAFIFMMSPIYNVVQFSYRLALIPDELQGRVNSTFRLVAFGFQPMGQALAGVLIDSIGTTGAILFYVAWAGVFAVVTTLNSHVRNARPIEQVVAEL
ncbi:MAG TPA: MFS transporter, partial [Chloroflexia bacterium]|nr:MFS transporter [Chloroflexia bacterium]